MTVAEGAIVATQRSVGPGGIYARLSERGHLIDRIREEVTARLPTHDETIALNIPPGVPVLELLHTSYDEQQRPFAVTRFIVRSDLSALDYTMPADR